MTRIRSNEVSVARPEGVDEAAILSVFRVPPEAAGQRVDVFLQGEFRRSSRTRTQAIIRTSGYNAEGRPLRVSTRVASHQLIALWRAPWDEVEVPTDITVLFEDEHLLAVDKPSGLPVHPTARYHTNTLIKILQSERPDQWLSLGHRLDRETSGVLLVTKSLRCDRALKQQFFERDAIEKEYAAITWGDPGQSRERRFRVEKPLELDPTHATNVKMRIAEEGFGMYAATEFEVDAVRHGARGAYALVRCYLETGRQHQIRAHLASVDTPIVGDKLYGHDDTRFARGVDNLLTDEDFAELELPRHALHAHRLSLPHPITSRPLDIIAPMPRDLEEFWSYLGH